MRPTRALLASIVVALLLVACGGGGELRWRDLRLTLPDGWSAYEERDDLLSVANVPLGEQADVEEPPEGDVLSMQFSHRPGVSPDTWRRYVEDLDGAELEVDEAIEVGGVPGRRLVYTSTTDGTTTREMIVVLPPREVEVLAQPVPRPGADGQAMFDTGLETFDRILDEASWGAPPGRSALAAP